MRQPLESSVLAGVAVGNHLADIMQHRGLTSKSLGKKIGLCDWTINYARKGRMSAETRDKIAAELEIKPDEIGPVTLGGTNGATKTIDAVEEVVAALPEPKIQSAETVQAVETARADGSLPDKLLTALFKARKERGFNQDEVQKVKDWATQILKEASALADIIQGTATIDVTPTGNIKVLSATRSIESGPKSEPKTKVVSLESAALRYIDEGVSKNKWKPYYVREKQSMFDFFKVNLDMKNVSDMTIPRFETAIIELARNLSAASIQKYAFAFCSFYRWVAEKGLGEDVLSGQAASANIKRLIKKAKRS